MLHKKMLRDFRQHLSQFITIFLMIAIGVMVFAGIEAYMAGMTTTANNFYRDYNLPELNIYGANFTTADLEQVKSLENVNDAERKLTITANVTDSDDKTLSLNFLESNQISQFYIVDGADFDPEKSGIWLDNFYAENNNLKVGDQIEFTYDNYTFTEEILGLINVPDQVYSVKDESELYPDHSDFGFAYLSSQELQDYIEQSAAAAAGISVEQLQATNFDYRDHLTFTTIMVDVKSDNSTDNSADNSTGSSTDNSTDNPIDNSATDNSTNSFTDNSISSFSLFSTPTPDPLASAQIVNSVKDAIESALPAASAIIKAQDSASYSTYQSEIDEGETYVGVFSGLFIFIALLSVVTTMTRIIKKQRLEIGTLKALGFSDRRIIFHYLGYGFWIALFGALLGLVLGYYFVGNVFIGLEMSFFQIPNGAPVMVSSSYLCALAVILATTLVTYLTCRTELRRMPAETLRLEAPSASAKSLRLTTTWLFRRLRFSTLWNIRDMLRNKARTLTGVVGIAGCAALIVCAFGMLDSLNHFVDLQFNTLYNFDYKLTLTSGISEDLTDQYGDFTSQTLLIETKDSSGTKSSNNIFITDAADRIRFVDDTENFISIDRDDGVFITYKLADQLGLEVGDEITWHVSGSDTWQTSPIVGLNRDPQNQNLTMTRAYFESLGFKYQPDSLYVNTVENTSANANTTEDTTNNTTHRTGDSATISNLSTNTSISGVETVQSKSALAASMENMLSTMKEMLVLIIAVAIILGFVIIYNTGILSYTEKQYQFATLKVLGFSDRRIRRIFIQQNTIITAAAIIIGLPAGFLLVDWLFRTAIGETFDFQAYITPLTFIIAALGTLVVSLLTSLLLSRKIRRIDMVMSLKSNE